jgi:hypothetical protein
VERVIYDHRSMTVIGAVPIKMRIDELPEIETRQVPFCLRGEIDTTTLRRKLRKQYAEDGRLKACGSGGRKPPAV